MGVVKQCSAERHKPRCRKDRPLCRWRRSAYAAKKFGSGGPCYCSAYHFPHRVGAGDCTARGGGGMPSILQQTQLAYLERMQDSEKSLCRFCGTVHRDHSWCARKRAS